MMDIHVQKDKKPTSIQRSTRKVPSQTTLENQVKMATDKLITFNNVSRPQEGFGLRNYKHVIWPQSNLGDRTKVQDDESVRMNDRNKFITKKCDSKHDIWPPSKNVVFQPNTEADEEVIRPAYTTTLNLRATQ